jgi:hypothetical protein
MSIDEKLRHFNESECCRFDDEYRMRFALSFGELRRYRRYLDLIFDRHKQAVAEFAENSRAMQAASKRSEHRGPFPTQGAVIAMAERVYFEVESFYVFANILLDKTATFIQFYFGVRGKAKGIGTHHELLDNLKEYAEERGLTVESAFLEAIRECRERISNFRTKAVVHENCSRTTRTTETTPEGSAQLALGRLEAIESDRDKFVQSEDFIDLSIMVDSYLEQVLAFVIANRKKTKLVLNRQTDPAH